MKQPALPLPTLGSASLYRISDHITEDVNNEFMLHPELHAHLGSPGDQRADASQRGQTGTERLIRQSSGSHQHRSILLPPKRAHLSQNQPSVPLSPAWRALPSCLYNLISKPCVSFYLCTSSNVRQTRSAAWTAPRPSCLSHYTQHADEESWPCVRKRNGGCVEQEEIKSPGDATPAGAWSPARTTPGIQTALFPPTAG